MANLSENEIFDCLLSSLRIAGEAAHKLATHPSNGWRYSELRKHLALIEGCTRQIAKLRLDTRWLTIAAKCGKALELSNNWISRYRYRDDKFLYELFMGLSEFMAFSIAFSRKLRMERTGTSEPIIPEHMKQADKNRIGSTVMKISNGGILIPEGVSV